MSGFNRSVGRPLGDISLALLSAAAEQPGTVRDLAGRSLVGYMPAARAASRLIDRGQLVRLSEARPFVLGTAPAQAPAGDTLADHLALLHQSFWCIGPDAADLPELGDARTFDAI